MILDTPVTQLDDLYSTRPNRMPLSDCLDMAAQQSAHTPKTQLMVVIPSALYPRKQGHTPTTKTVEAHTGLFFLDIDTYEDPEAIFSTALAWQHSALVKYSASGGVHIFYRMLPNPRSGVLADDHTQLARAGGKIFEADTGLSADPACVDVVRRCFFAPSEYALGQDIPLVPALANIKQGDRHNAMRNWAFHAFVEEARPIERIQDTLRAANIRLGSPETEQGIDAMLKNLPDAVEHHQEQDTGGNGVILQTSTDICKAFARTGRFQARYNVLTHALEVSSADPNNWHVPHSADRLFAVARECLPSYVWRTGRSTTRHLPNHVLRTAVYEYAVDYNPVEEILEQAVGSPATDAEIAQIASQVFQCDIVRNPHYADALIKVYTDVALRMLLCSNSSLDARPSFFLTLVGPQGCGKTAFVEQFLPDAFRQYTGQLTAAKWSDAVTQASSRFVLEYPEIAGERRSYDKLPLADFRSLITLASFDAVHKYMRDSLRSKNNAVIIATANPDGDPMLDRTGNRRQLIIRYPNYPSIAASMTAGKQSAEVLHDNNWKLLLRGIVDAKAIIAHTAYGQVSVEMDPQHEHLWLAAQAHSTETLDMPIIQALVTIVANLDGWRSLARPGSNPNSVHGFCPTGGVWPPALKDLARYFAGDPSLTSQAINRILGLNPNIIKSVSVSPIHRNYGRMPASAAALYDLAKSVYLVEDVAEAIESNPHLYADPIFSAWKV